MSLNFLLPIFIAALMLACSIGLFKMGYTQFQDDFRIAVEKYAPKAFIKGDVTIKSLSDKDSVSLSNMDIRGNIYTEGEQKEQ